MAVNNSLTKQNAKPKFSAVITSEGYTKLINQTLGDPQKARTFVAAITSAVATNPQLQSCEAASIVSAALLGESLNLNPSPQLGQYYLVPYKKKIKNSDGTFSETTLATFQMGWKGYYQLAVRSGVYRKINAIAIKKGELVRYDALNEEIEVNLIEDEFEREQTETIGYYAFYEYLTGFRKAIYWSAEKMLAHADRYSQAFSADAYKKLKNGEIPERDMWKYSSFWYKNFDEMALKTMYRQLLKTGAMSLEFERAFINDTAVVDSTNYNNPEYLTEDFEAVPDMPSPTEQAASDFFAEGESK